MGFSKPPADHYYRSTYWPITKERGLKGSLRNRLVGKADNYACQQEVPSHTHQFRILRDLLLHQEGPTFAYVHLNEYTHNDLTMARHYDEPLKQLVTDLSKAGALNNTFFLLLADHGFQRGDNPFTLTEQVPIERKLWENCFRAKRRITCRHLCSCPQGLLPRRSLRWRPHSLKMLKVLLPTLTSMSP